MSRAMNLAMTAEEVRKHCDAKEIDISVLEALPDGGVRLVCSSGDGAEKVRAKFSSKIMDGAARRTLFRPTKPFW